jgi:translation initiation factor IF-2
VAEDWGGKTVVVPISAKTGQGIPELLDMILLTADMLELKANPDTFAQAVVIESRLSRRKGPVATVIVKTGTLRVGDLFAVGTISGRVRAMLNDLGVPVTVVGPGTPTEILGLAEVPHPGDFLEVVDSEKSLKTVVEAHKNAADRSHRMVKNISLESLSQSIHDGQVRRLNLIVKADVNGSLEAVLESIKQIPTHDIQINVLHAATGPVIENDVVLARASEAIIIGFGVAVNADAQRLAEDEAIEVKTYTIIYQIVDDIEKVLVGMFKAEYEDVEVGQVEIRQLYHFSKVGTILGSYVLSGRVKRGDGVQVMRGKNVLGDTKVETLKRFKEDVKEVTHGYECGVVLADPIGVEVGDRLVLMERREKRRK